MISLGGDRLAALLNLGVDTPLQHPRAQYLRPDDRGWSWSDPLLAEHAEVAVSLPNGDRLL